MTTYMTEGKGPCIGRLGTGVGSWCQALATPLIWVGQVFLLSSTLVLPDLKEPGPGLLLQVRAL